MTRLPFETGEFVQLLPVLIPALFGLAVLLADLAGGRARSKVPLAFLSAGGALLAAFAALALWGGAREEVYLAGAISTSRFGAALALAVTMATVIISFAVAHHGRPEPGQPDSGRTIAHGELYGLMLFASSGMLALIVANDLVTVFLGVEVLSISVYALTGIDRSRERSAEGAMKYFVLGAFSSGFLLYGMALVYGSTGTIRLDELAARAGSITSPDSMATLGGMLLMVGLLFKVAAVPFHAWSPDAYEGAPSAVTGFMSVGVKVAAFAAALRVLIALGKAGAIGTPGAWTLWTIAALTVIVGNAGALTQRNPRRLLAYSSIAHTGYVLIGLVALARSYDPLHPGSGPQLAAAGQDAIAGVIFYMLGYAAANLGAFAVLCHLERNGQEVDDVADLAGLARTQPGAAFAMLVSLISLAGIPGTAGFIGKLWVFRAGVATGDIGLVVLALVASAMSLFYYLRIVVVMYMHEPGARVYAGAEHAAPAVAPRAIALDPMRWSSRMALTVAAALTVILGLVPSDRLLAMIERGAQALFLVG